MAFNSTTYTINSLRFASPRKASPKILNLQPRVVFVYRVNALLDDLVVRRGTKRVSIRFTASMEHASAL